MIPLLTEVTLADLLWWLLFATSATVAALNMRFIWIDVASIMHRAVDHLEHDRIKLYLHLGTAPAILMSGVLNLKPGLRDRWPAFHRWNGRFYLIAVLVTAPVTFLLALNETEGPMTVWGFATLSALWGGSAILAWVYAVKGNIDAHRDWMIRNVALVLTNVTFRVELHLALLLGIPFDAVYEPIRSLQFIPNLLAAELLIRSGMLKTGRGLAKATSGVSRGGSAAAEPVPDVNKHGPIVQHGRYPRRRDRIIGGMRHRKGQRVEPEVG